MDTRAALVCLWGCACVSVGTYARAGEVRGLPHLSRTTIKWPLRGPVVCLVGLVGLVCMKSLVCEYE